MRQPLSAGSNLHNHPCFGRLLTHGVLGELLWASSCPGHTPVSMREFGSVIASRNPTYKNNMNCAVTLWNPYNTTIATQFDVYSSAPPDTIYIFNGNFVGNASQAMLSISGSVSLVTLTPSSQPSRT